MTEQEWFSSADPAAMLAHIQGKVSDRKLRLFACSCCRQVWHLLADDATRGMVLAGERMADGGPRATQEEWRRLHNARAAVSIADRDSQRWQAVWMSSACAESAISAMAEEWATRCTSLVPASTQADLARDIVGNPFRPARLPLDATREQPCPDCPPGEPEEYCDDCSGLGTVNERYCSWLTPDVLALAQAAYEGYCEACKGVGAVDNGDTEPHPCGRCHGSGRIDDGTLGPATLAVLADALEEAGCDDAEILLHLRGEPCDFCRGSGSCFEVDAVRVMPGGRREVENPRPAPCLVCDGTGRQPAVHVRGCWALDLILGKE